MTVDLADIERELETIGALGAPTFTSISLPQKTSAQPLADEDRRLVQQVSSQLAEGVVLVEAQVSDIERRLAATKKKLGAMRQLAADLGQLAHLSMDADLIEEEEDVADA